MFDKLEDLVNRYEDIMRELQSPDVANDAARFRKLMKEQSDLSPIVEAYTSYKKSRQDIEDSISMLESESDEEMREMLKEELSDYDIIEVDNVYHDTGNMKHHKYFKYQPLKYIDLNDDKIICKCSEITFLETNHTNCLDDNNTMLQFIDLFLGANFDSKKTSAPSA